MRRFVPPAPRRSSFVRLLSGMIVAVGLALTTMSAQIPGRNVNMVAGNVWPDGDPYLQRQNEPSIGASTRNPLHLLAGSNDYRTVDLPGLTDDEVGDAWLGLYKSYDGGQRWTSTLLPGYPQDQSAAGQASPIHGYGAGADAVVRAGTNGLMYYAGLSFDRSKPATPDVPGKSAIFVARFIDNNNKEAGDTFEYLGTRALQTDPGGVGGNFLDKPWMVVDIPRDNARCTIVTNGEKGQITQSVPAGPVYVAYTLRSTDNKGPRYDVMFTRSADCGNTWTTPVKLNDNNERANQGASLAVDPRNGNVYISWRQFDLSANNTGTDALMAAKFTLANKKFDKPGFARKFAKPKNGNGNGLDPNHFYKKGGVNQALDAVALSPLDQSTSATQIRFRTNAYPTMAVDEMGRVYLAFAERGYDPVNPDPVLGAARVLVTTSTDGQTWTAAQAVNVSEPGQKGHQLMPSLTYAGGKLMLIYYDLRETRSQVFSKYIDDKTAFAQDTRVTGLRHTIDLRASMASPGAAPAFAPSVAVSEYLQGPRAQGRPSTPWQVNPPNLPMFQKGTAPFIGDYVDVAAAPNFITNAAGQWVYNSTAGSTPPVFHAVWTDNRDVRAPLHDINGDGNPWNDYVPPGAPGGFASIFDPTKVVPQCIPGNAGSRNQNVYTARITGGLLVGSPGNTKRLGYRIAENGQPTNVLMQRSFVVFAQNTADVQRRFRFTLTNQPLGGRASFDQFSSAPLTVIEADIPYRSTASRTVYASSTDPHAIVNVAVSELVFVNGVWIVKAGGLGSVIVLNPDIDNPDIDNPDIDNPDIDNPDIDNVEVYNPDIDNPDIDNPDIDNPDIDNPDIDNPDIDNVEVANPDIDNPDIDNPDIDNPDIDNPDIDNPDIDNAPVGSLMTDVSWSMTNTGNTTASYNVNLFFAQQTFDPTIKTQLILYRTYKTPVVLNCALKSETRNVLVANVPNPQLVKGSTGTVSNPNDSAATNATIYLAPGESAKITLRVFDPSPDPGSVVTVTNADGSTALISSQFVPNEDVTPVVQQQSVNTVDVDAGVTEPPVVVQFPAPQTVVDAASTSENTPVTLNVLANDSTAFGSTKVISFHPAGMAAHSGGGVGDITYQPSTGFLYTARGAVDPVTNALVARFPLPPSGFGITSHQANMKNGINYGRTGGPGATLTALDARPDSTTFHTYLPMPAVSASDIIFSFAIDAPHNRIYVLHGHANAGPLTHTTVSVIAIGTANPISHQLIGSVSLPIGLRGQTTAVNTRTQKLYVAANGTQGGGQSGVFVIDMTAAVPSALRIPNTTQAAFGVVVNESANQIFASSAIGPFPNSSFSLYAIDGDSNAAISIPTALPFRFGSNDERLAVHEASGKVYMRLQNKVVVIDGKRGSPTRNTVIATIAVGEENGNADIAVDQEKGIVVTVGSLDFQADVIDVASNALLTSIPLSTWGQDVAIDPIRHRAFIGVFTHVLPVQLDSAIVVGLPVPVFIESGGIVINPLNNKGYAGLLTTKPEIAVLSGAGREGTLSGTGEAGRYVYSAWHDASNRGFFVNQGNAAGTSAAPGTVVVIDGATETILRYTDVPPSPFGIGIDQVNHKVYVASLSALNTHGQVAILDALAPENPRVLATFTAAINPNTPTVFPLNGTGSLLGFGRHVVVNPVTHKVYLMLLGGSATSLAVLDPATNALTPLDGIAGTALYAAQAAAEENWGRVNVIRVHEGLNRVFVGYLDSNNVGRIVALDGTTHAVVGGPYVGGSHSNRHMASFLVVNEPASLLYVTDYTNNKVTMLGAGDLEFVKDLTLPGGPSATAFNPVSNRLYVSSINSKTLSAIDGATLQVISTVKLPLTAYFMWVDPVESRIYTSGGDSADESGAMVVTDVLGQLGTNVSVTSVGSALKGTTQLNADNSVTYTPAPGQFGLDSFSYNIAAPTGTAVGTVNINIVSSSPAPIAFPDSYTTLQGQLLSVPAPGPLANDASPNSPGMNVTQTTTNGTLTPQPNGSFTYQPNPGFTGVDTFTYYAIDDSLGNSNEVTVSITVTSTASLVVTNTSDGGAGSLRQALLTAQIEPNSTIRFAIADGTAPYIITPQSPLPTLTTPTTIDGYTQNGSSPNTSVDATNAVIAIQLQKGASITNNVHGLSVTGGNTTIRGLSIVGWGGSGIMLDNAGDNFVEGNWIGVTAAGAALGNAQSGVTSQSSGNTIGGTLLAARNLISGNSGQGVRVQARTSGGVVQSNGTGTTVVNNQIGTNAAGTAAVANTSGGIQVASPNVIIGGGTSAHRNVIAGNGGVGITTFATTTGSPQVPLSSASSLTVQGNYIGVSVSTAGVATAIGNSNGGMSLTGANSLIGGPNPQAGISCEAPCNLVSGNGNIGIVLSGQQDNIAKTVITSAAGSIIEGNWVGVNATGTAAMANSNTGIQVNAPGVRVGGPTAGQGNLVSGNSGNGIFIGQNTYSNGSFQGPTPAVGGTGAFVYGNIVGLNKTGTGAIPNQNGIGVNVPNVTIGGMNAGERNLIGGNNGNGISASAATHDPDGAGPLPFATMTPPVVPTGLTITNNYIGTDVSGNNPVGNARGGLGLSAPGVQVRHNLISGNGNTGLSLGSHTSSSGVVFTNSAGAIVTGNLIGVSASGTAVLANGHGISVSVPDVRIGGTTLTERNIISGNSAIGVITSAGFFDPDGPGPLPSQSISPAVTPARLIVQGNYIGTSADGSQALANLGGGLYISGDHSEIRDNLISGNLNPNPGTFTTGLGIGTSFENNPGPLQGTVYSSPDYTVVHNNIIGLNAAGTAALANGSGISVNGPLVFVGGPNAGERNVVSGNIRTGIGFANNHVTATNTLVATAAGSVVRGNYVGLNAAGTSLIVNGQGGIHSSSPNVTIGGPNAEDRNFVVAGSGSTAIGLFRHTSQSGVLISAAGSNWVQNNVLGLAADLTTRLNALGTPLYINSASNQIHGNVIAGNGTAAASTGAINVSAFPAGTANGNIIRGNFIGTNAAGVTGLHNFGVGISINNASGTQIGGLVASEGNTIVGGKNVGVMVSASPLNAAGSTAITGNRIGIMPDGQTAQDSAFAITTGIMVSPADGGSVVGTIIGGDQPGMRNVIGSNAFNGIGLYNSGAQNAVIRGNYIGVAADGVTARGNGAAGVWISGSTDNTVGGTLNAAAEANIIAFNAQVGVGINNNGVRNRILSNSIHSNTGMGIDLEGNNAVENNDPGDGDGGANSRQNFPVLNGATNSSNSNTQVNIDISTFVPGGTYTVQVFSNVACDAGNFGEGRRLVGTFSVVQPGAGVVTLDEVVANGQFLTSTATDSQGNTSEFSNCVTVTGGTTVSGTTRYGGNPVQGVTMKLAQGSPTNPPVATTVTQADGTFQFAGVAPGSYHLRVDGPDSSYLGWTAQSITVASSNVVQDMQLVKKITLLTPAHGSSGVSATPDLTWTANPEAQRYMVQINRTSDWALIENTQVFTNTYRVATLLAGNVNYTWQVHAVDANNRDVGASENQFNFTVAPATTWAAAGPGTVTVIDNGSTSTPKMSYDHSGAGITSGTWAFATTAGGAGNISLDYNWTGFHSFYQATANLQVFVNRGGTDIYTATLVSAGPVDCPPCTPPSNGFTYTGTAPVTVQPGDSYGFRLSGSHFDATYVLSGQLNVTVRP